MAELASSDLLPVVTPDTLVVAVSASAGSVETLDAVDRLGVPVVAVANRPGPLTERASHTVWMQAGEERGGVACRSFQHTLALLLALESGTWSGRPVPPVADAADAAEDLLARADTWRPAARRAAARSARDARRRPGPPDLLGVPVGADAARGAAAARRRLRDRRLEPRRRLPDEDHRLPDAPAGRVPVGAAAAGVDGTARHARSSPSAPRSPARPRPLRYVHDDVDDVRLLTETLVGELVAAHAWLSDASSA